MKAIYSALVVLMLAGCSQSKEDSVAAGTTDATDYSVMDKYLGTWSAEDEVGEIITIAKAKNFDSAHVCLINDGKTEIAFPYNIKEDKFRLRQPDYWVEILHDATNNQLHWKVIHYDEAEGKVVRKYNFKAQ